MIHRIAAIITLGREGRLLVYNTAVSETQQMNKEPQYTLLSATSVLLILLAVLTVLPHPDSKPDLLGYHTLCAFVPLSTLVLLGLAGFVRIMRNTLYRSQSPRLPG